ncbi:glycosyltransferase family 2 protein [Flavitalea antarctica]
MKHIPKVSVLIPTYNYGYCLDVAVQSVMDQGMSDFELIVIDDHSSDNTDEVMEKYLSDPRITYVRNEQNLGLVGNWNKCLSYAKGEYIKFLCADDYFRSDLLCKMVNVMEQHPGVSLVVCNKQMFGKSSAAVKLPLTYLHSGREIIHNTLSTYGWLGEPTCIMFRRSNMSVGVFRCDVTWLPDWEMWLRQLNVGDAYFIPEPLAFVRNHEQQVTKTVMKKFINYFEEYHMCRDIRDRRGYDIDTSGIDMNKIVKARAQKVGKAMYKLIPKVYMPEERKIFLKALKIAWHEQVILSSLGQMFKKGTGKTMLTIEETRSS